MTACFTYRLAPSLALLLGLAGSLAACIDPKSIGDETDDQSGSASADSGSESEGSESTGQGQTTGQTTGATTEPTTEPTGNVDNGIDCPPIDIPACTECICVDGEWACDDSACVAECTGQACGTACVLCPEDDPDCLMPDEGVCTADEQCVGVPPPKLGFCEGALQPGFEGELEQASGCIDMLVFARDAADERGLVLRVDQGLVDETVATGMPVHVELSATDPTVTLEGRAGFYVTEAECNDAIGNDPDVKELWLPTAGTVIVDLQPTGGGLATATVQLVDVELHRQQPGPAPLTVNVTWTDVIVGGIPG